MYAEWELGKSATPARSPGTAGSNPDKSQIDLTSPGGSLPRGASGQFRGGMPGGPLEAPQEGSYPPAEGREACREIIGYQVHQKANGLVGALMRGYSRGFPVEAFLEYRWNSQQLRSQLSDTHFWGASRYIGFC